MTPLEWPARDLLSHRVDATPQRTALIDADEGTQWTYREFDRRVEAAVAALEREGIGRGDRVGTLLDTRPAFAVLVFAAMRRGATLVPFHARETVPELVSKASRTDLAALVCGRETESTALEVARGLDEAPTLRSVDEPTDGAVSPVPTSPETGENTASEPASLAREDTAVIMFTSGTTGRPKGVRLTVGNLVASATASALRLGVDPDDRWLCCLPMFHMGGLAPVLRSTLYGTTVVIQRAFDPAETARVIEREAVTGVSLVPTMCKRLLEVGWEPTDALRFVLLGGAPASESLLERCRERNVPVYPTYGMTETASQIATATPEETATHEGTVGQPLVNTDVTIVDEEGQPVETGVPGEIVVSGPTVTPGYLEAEHTESAVSDRGLRTGDIGRRDEDGRLWILNRRSDRIVTGGENVDPGEVIEVLRSHPNVADASVVGLADPEWGERVAALVVPAEDGALEPESILAHCEDRLAGFKRPKTVAVADALPRTASGTVDREAVRDRLREDGVDVASRS